MKLLKVTGKFLSILLSLVLAVILIANLYTIAARRITGQLQPAVFGWSWAVVVSGSMVPEIQVNDLVIVHEEETYVVGDIITYENGSSVVTHRIIAETEQGFTTKGDYNNAEDMDPVSVSAVVGRVVLVIPGVGTLIEYLRSPLGMTCMVLIGFLLIEIPYLLDKRREDKGGSR